MSGPTPSAPSVAVVLCTHNPRADYLQQTLAALRCQTLPPAAWEFVVVDNASVPPLASHCDLSWHSQARCVAESKVGLTHARIRGIQETSAPLLVFVDDDNLLAPDYLAQAVDVGRDHPFLGAWGGKIEGVFELTPPDWCRQRIEMLAIRDVTADLWSNTTEDLRSVPCGAGMCIRRKVAEAWIADINSRPAGLQLGRAGRNLGACEDSHLALISCRLGLGTGVFRRLALRHLIPKERMTLDYFTRLAAGHVYSYNLLRHLLGQPVPARTQSGSERLLNLYRRWRSSPAARSIETAMERAYDESRRDLGLDNR